MLIDTHAHLDLPQFDDDREAVIHRAQDEGVGAVINPGIHLESSRAAVHLAEGHDAIYAAVGVHPHDSETFDGRALEHLAPLSLHPKVVAIGEVGLDYYRDYAPREVQERVFREQIRFARELNKPLIIHSRAAEDEVLRILEQEGGRAVRGILHCWGGTLEQARRACSLGFLLGFGGTITFKKSDRLKVALELGIENIVLETDAPYIAPVPHRGKRNEPAFVKLVAEKLAEAAGCAREEVERITGGNASALFGITG